MIAFEGPEVILGISIEDLKDEINDLSRLGKLLPEGAVKDFTSDGDKCSFKVKGGVSIHLEKRCVRVSRERAHEIKHGIANPC